MGTLCDAYHKEFESQRSIPDILLVAISCLFKLDWMEETYWMSDVDLTFQDNAY